MEAQRVTHKQFNRWLKRVVRNQDRFGGFMAEELIRVAFAAYKFGMKRGRQAERRKQQRDANHGNA